MAKRHKGLVPLARDHHDGLLLALRLQQGKQALPRLWSHDPFEQAKHVVTFYEEHLRHHFEAEEKGLFPLAAHHVTQSRPLVEVLIRQHRTLESYVARFRTPGPQTLEQDLKEFGKILEDHIRKEDRELFPMLEEHAPAHILLEVEKQVGHFYPPDTNK
ncbi:MAG: hemerythrin domain-containing protein [Ignavibacteriales bacterium]|nr:hemerythrin domain-containing protein [Ignavibacteriales bacterium]MBI3786748.1 hemerythrin domain-containing protein [Ignavibacteriales bacterium]